MKKLFLSVFLVVCMSGMALGQATGYIRTPKGDHDEVFQKMYCPTEGDYVINTMGTAIDTSAIYKLTGVRNWEQIWAWAKPDNVDEDSLEMVLWFDVKSVASFDGAATTSGLGWLNVDSMLVGLADTLGGVVKELAIPAATKQIRMRQAGTTDSDTTGNLSNETWLIFKE